MQIKWLATVLAGLFFFTPAFNQTAFEVIKKADEKLKGNSSYAQMKMKINRKDWSREIVMKAWSKGDDETIILITSPKRDQGTAFLKKGREMWNWQPTIERVIKMPPSMMMQSWMGSDFTNDDLVRQSSMVTDYTHKFVGEETLEGRPCYIIELKPKPDAPVVWGKIKIWISKKEYLQLKGEFYDEDNFKVNTMYGLKVKEMGKRLIPSLMRIVPEEEPTNSTEAPRSNICHWNLTKFLTKISLRSRT
jgi:outer membrane lipoprotein-sorting protein